MCLACMYRCALSACLVPTPDLLEQGLQMGVSCHMHAGNQIRTLNHGAILQHLPLPRPQQNSLFLKNRYLPVNFSLKVEEKRKGKNSEAEVSGNLHHGAADSGDSGLNQQSGKTDDHRSPVTGNEGHKR